MRCVLYLFLVETVLPDLMLVSPKIFHNQQPYAPAKSNVVQHSVDLTDSVTALATQLLQDESDTIVQHSPCMISCVGVQPRCEQALQLSELLPRLNNLAIVEGNEDLLMLVHQAQGAATRILQSYESFITTPQDAISADPNPVLPQSSEGTANSKHLRSEHDEKSVQVISRDMLSSVQSSPLTSEKGTWTPPLGNNQESSSCTILDRAYVCAVREKANGSVKENDRTLRNLCTAEVQCDDKANSSAGNIHRNNSAVRMEQGRLMKKYKIQLDKLRIQLGEEQCQIRSLSVQLYETQRELEKGRIGWLQKESLLQAQLRAQHAKEVDLIKINASLRNDLRLAQYQIDQLQFRLSLIEQVKHDDKGKKWDSPLDPSCICILPKGQEQPASLGLMVGMSTLIPKFDKVLCERQLDITSRHSESSGIDLCPSPMGSSKQPSSYSDETPNRVLPLLSLANPLGSNDLTRSMKNSSAAFQTPIKKRHANEDPKPSEANTITIQAAETDNQSTCSDVSLATTVSSLRTVDELEFRNGLALLDQRINSVRSVLQPQTDVVQL
ncbi:unnamed protein product [Calicophoron daubneyi]|uniref:Uncharacterized protein n=1 Tax=Calicophoron daubneyi TaxID=300641 RepID=A0AAV2TJP3_CALDB